MHIANDEVGEEMRKLRQAAEDGILLAMRRMRRTTPKHYPIGRRALAILRMFSLRKSVDDSEEVPKLLRNLIEALASFLCVRCLPLAF